LTMFSCTCVVDMAALSPSKSLVLLPTWSAARRTYDRCSLASPQHGPWCMTAFCQPPWSLWAGLILPILLP
jgi:hypothetical protein